MTYNLVKDLEDFSESLDLYSLKYEKVILLGVYNFN